LDVRLESRGSHSITSSAPVSSAGGTFDPSDLAVFRFMVSSNFGWLNEWQVRRSFAFHDTAAIDTGSPIRVAEVCAETE
jgi:hypothetical protein